MKLKESKHLVFISNLIMDCRANTIENVCLNCTYFVGLPIDSSCLQWRGGCQYWLWIALMLTGKHASMPLTLQSPLPELANRKRAQSEHWASSLSTCPRQLVQQPLQTGPIEGSQSHPGGVQLWISDNTIDPSQCSHAGSLSPLTYT